MPRPAGQTLSNGKAEATEMPASAANEEAGAQDNRLSLDPNAEQFAFAQDWQDGSEYVIKELRVRQISPGEFEVVSAEAGEGVGEEGPPEEATGAMGRAMDEYPNPAVAGMMGKGKRGKMMEE